MADLLRLNTWKEIARYIDRDVKTCMKWAKTYGLPVYRIDIKSKRSSVFAYVSEIEEWFKSREKQIRR
jgi:hypothetical protein